MVRPFIWYCWLPVAPRTPTDWCWRMGLSPTLTYLPRACAIRRQQDNDLRIAWETEVCIQYPPSLPHSFIHSFIHSFSQSVSQSVSHTLTHSLTYSLIHSLTHSLPHLLIHSLIITILTLSIHSWDRDSQNQVGIIFSWLLTLNRGWDCLGRNG